MDGAGILCSRDTAVEGDTVLYVVIRKGTVSVFLFRYIWTYVMCFFLYSMACIDMSAKTP